ncbi:MAG: biopolymer transporter ExbD [Rhodoferax sp.]|jgi:biopolymer transport protein ExbD|nr:biopolymer transporter ExbD [Rhodoferax sp.]
MAITYQDRDDDSLLSEINTTPLVDVMLVLLIIFLITVPVINTSVVVRLPRQANQLQQSQADTVLISVDARGGTYWFDARVHDAHSLQQRLRQAAERQPQPAVHIRGDARADYEAVARVLQAAQAAGIARIGFVTEPPGAVQHGD